MLHKTAGILDYNVYYAKLQCVVLITTIYSA